MLSSNGKKNEQDVEQVKKAIKDFNIDSETIIEDWKRIQELKPNTDEGKQTLADFLTTTSDKITNHYSEKALKMDIRNPIVSLKINKHLKQPSLPYKKILEIIKRC